MIREICRPDDVSSGEAVFFDGFVRGELRGCFLVRDGDGFFAYLNVCAHRNQPVVVERHAVDAAGLVECRAHGAKYLPRTGECVEGPCVGARLVPLRVVVSRDTIGVEDDDVVDDSIYDE